MGAPSFPLSEVMATTSGANSPRSERSKLVPSSRLGLMIPTRPTITPAPLGE